MEQLFNFHPGIICSVLSKLFNFSVFNAQVSISCTLLKQFFQYKRSAVTSAEYFVAYKLNRNKFNFTGMSCKCVGF